MEPALLFLALLDGRGMRRRADSGSSDSISRIDSGSMLSLYRRTMHSIMFFQPDFRESPYLQWIIGCACEASKRVCDASSHVCEVPAWVFAYFAKLSQTFQHTRTHAHTSAHTCARTHTHVGTHARTHTHSWHACVTSRVDAKISSLVKSLTTLLIGIHTVNTRAQTRSSSRLCACYPRGNTRSPK